MSDHREHTSNPKATPSANPDSSKSDAPLKDLAPKLTPEQEDKLRGGLSNREPGVYTN